jgi:hypothetical protein
MEQIILAELVKRNQMLHGWSQSASKSSQPLSWLLA